MKICAYSSICEEDAIWIPQYLAEVERLNIPFVINLDRCSNDTKTKLIHHPNCVGYAWQDDPAIEFDETHKQQVFDLIVKWGFTWAMAWDVDETYERQAPHKIDEICNFDVDYVDVTWLNLWEDPAYIRTDGPFCAGHRVKFYNLKRRKWKFTHPITNGAKIVDSNGKIVGSNPSRERMHRYDLVTLHWGMMTRALRLQHKERWDRIYSTALRGDPNPYGFWNYACDEVTYPPIVQKHNYL